MQGSGTCNSAKLPRALLCSLARPTCTGCVHADAAAAVSLLSSHFLLMYVSHWIEKGMKRGGLHAGGCHAEAPA